MTIQERLRGNVQKLRTKFVPLCDMIPLMQEAADELDAILAASRYSADLASQALDTVHEQADTIDRLKAELGYLTNENADAARFNALLGVDHIAVNKWLVQVMSKDSYHSAYYAQPSGGIPQVVHETKLEALRFAIDQHTKERKIE